MNERVESAWRRLLRGLLEQRAAEGAGFALRYDGRCLDADDGARLMMPSMVCLAQALSQDLEMGGFGLSFRLVEQAPGALPLLMQWREPGPEVSVFAQSAPFLLEEFEARIGSRDNDLVTVFEAAANVISPGFRVVGGATWAGEIVQT